MIISAFHDSLGNARRQRIARFHPDDAVDEALRGRSWRKLNHQNGGSRAQPFAQPDGVEGRVHLGVVVEVNVDVARGESRRRRGGDVCRVGGLAAALPLADARGPPVELRVGVSASVELLGAVQADVDELRRDVLRYAEAAAGTMPRRGSLARA